MHNSESKVHHKERATVRVKGLSSADKYRVIEKDELDLKPV
jgi:hypothetical protein